MEYTDVERQILANQKENKALMLQVLKQLDTFGVSMKYGFKPVYSEKVVNKKIADTQKIASIYREGHTGVMGKTNESQIITSNSMTRSLRQQFKNTAAKTSTNREVTYYFHKPESVTKYVLDVLDMYEKIWESMGDSDDYHNGYNKFIGFERGQNLVGIYYKLEKIVYYEDNRAQGQCDDDKMYVDFVGRYQEIHVKHFRARNRDYTLTKDEIKYIQGISDTESDELDKKLSEKLAKPFNHRQVDSINYTDFSE